MKIVVGSVVYVEALDYLEDFFDSIEKQNYNDFEILLINDNFSLNQLEKLVKRTLFKHKVTIIDTQAKLTPVELRLELLKEAKARFDFLILSDCDDIMTENRVQCFAESLEDTYGFYYNEIRTLEYGKVMPKLPVNVDDWKDISEYNFLGMSNTAIDVSLLSIEFIDSLSQCKTNIFDWYLYTRIVLEGLKGKKVDSCFTLYRIHNNNLAGIISNTKQALMREIEIKLKHYDSLKEYNNYLQLYEKYKTKAKHLQIADPEDKLYFWWGLIENIDTL